ncbi:MAG: hypothetical protein IPM33_01240 [Phycisphaerales bacterium]|nr:hypothetical protein [Phycisphaerales bacterium]
MNQHTSNASRGSVLFAVLVVVAIGAMIGTSVMLRAQSHRALAGVGVRKTQTTALAWSGVNAAMAEMAAQRESILDGGEPTLTSEWELFREGAWRGVVRLVPLGEGGQVCIPENARLDANLASKEMLAALPGVGDAIADKIIAARGQGLSSIEPLRGLAGAPVADELRVVTPAPPSTHDGTTGNHAWIDHLTVFSFDPDLQAGVAGNEAGKGLQRVGLSNGWTDGARSAVADRFGEDIARVAEAVFKDAPPLTKDSQLVALLRRVGSKPKDWAAALDFFATSPDEYRVGRVDLNRASEAVLACIPGIDAAAASKIVGTRESLSAATRLNVAWPAAEGILTEEQFEQAVDWLCVRSTQWRVRIEAGLLPVDEGVDSAWPAQPSAGERFSGRAIESFDDAPPPMTHAMILEAVIDVSGRRPRLAYLRDVTYLDQANELRAHIVATQAEAALRQPPPEPPPEPEPELTPPPPARPDTLSERPERSVTPPPAEDPGERPGNASEEQKPVDRRIGRWTPGRRG